MIRVVIVDDSPDARHALRRGLERDAEVLVVGEAATAAEALAEIRRLDPDLVTLDVSLGEEHGFDVSRRIMAEHRLPILMISTPDIADPSLPFRALEAGAVDAAARLPPPEDPTYPDRSTELARLAKAVARTSILHGRRGRATKRSPSALRPPRLATRHSSTPGTRAGAPQLVVIGASTGGPSVVARLLRAIPAPSPVPILVAQHLAAGFTRSFGQWLTDTTSHAVRIIDQPGALARGTVHLAADDHHFELTSCRSIAARRTTTTACAPSIDLLFSSVATHWQSTAVAILLTGMGTDGSRGLAHLDAAGAQTIVQAPASCAVSSIPRSALARGIRALVLDPAQAASWLSSRAWTLA